MKEPDSWLRCGGACCSVSGKAEKISSGLDKQFILYAVTLLESDKRIPGLFRQGQLLCSVHGSALVPGASYQGLACSRNAGSGAIANE